jgi:hypothetical protein
MISQGRNQAIALDKQAAALLRKANALLLRGPSQEGCQLLREAVTKYERIPSLDPEAGTSARMIIACIRVDIAECLIRLSSGSDRQEATNFAKMAIPVLEEARERGVYKCDKYIKRAHRILSDQPLGSISSLQVEMIKPKQKGLSPAIWAAIIGAIAALLAAVIGALLR